MIVFFVQKGRNFFAMSNIYIKFASWNNLVRDF